MKPASFDYHCPHTLDEAIALLADFGGDAKPLAGGQSLIPAMNFRLAVPSVLVDLNGIGSLSYIRRDTDGLRIGGMTRHRMLERSEAVAECAPLIAAAMPFVAHPAIRTRGTLGGSLAHADPAAELPAVMLALDASFTVHNRAGSRTVPAAEFFTGLFSTALDTGELLTEVAIPGPRARTGYGFQEISRRHGDFALAGAAAAVAVDTKGTCTMARIALLSVGDRPVLAGRLANALVGQRPTAASIREAAEASAAHDIDPPGDIHASSRYRRHLAAVLMQRVVKQALSHAGGWQVGQS
jgi:CO/xanthine dehydrogenase FAD-binding subunit